MGSFLVYSILKQRNTSPWSLLKQSCHFYLSQLALKYTMWVSGGQGLSRTDPSNQNQWCSWFVHICNSLNHPGCLMFSNKLNSVLLLSFNHHSLSLLSTWLPAEARCSRQPFPLAEVTPSPPVNKSSIFFSFCLVTMFSSQTVTAVISPVAPVKTNMA